MTEPAFSLALEVAMQQEVSRLPGTGPSVPYRRTLSWFPLHDATLPFMGYRSIAGLPLNLLDRKKALRAKVKTLSRTRTRTTRAGIQRNKYPVNTVKMYHFILTVYTAIP